MDEKKQHNHRGKLGDESCFRRVALLKFRLQEYQWVLRYMLTSMDKSGEFTRRRTKPYRASRSGRILAGSARSRISNDCHGEAKGEATSNLPILPRPMTELQHCQQVSNTRATLTHRSDSWSADISQ